MEVSLGYQGAEEEEHPQWEGVGQALGWLSAQAVGQVARVVQLPSLSPSAEVFLLAFRLQIGTPMCQASPPNDYLVLHHWIGAS